MLLLDYCFNKMISYKRIVVWDLSENYKVIKV